MNSFLGVALVEIGLNASTKVQATLRILVYSERLGPLASVKIA